MNILITGSCGGMGLAAAKLLTEKGHKVYGLDLAEPKEEIPFTFVRTDLTDEQSVIDAFGIINAEGVKIDAVIHHAGIYDLNSLVEMKEEEVLKIFSVNLLASVRVNRIFLPLLSEGAKIIITTSELGPLDPLPFTGIYAVTKAAAEKYAYSLRMELQLLGYKVIVLRPGAVRTSLLGVSTKRLDDFCSDTKIYKCNAERFRKIVESVEAKSIPPEKIARLDLKILGKKSPKYVYNINRNILLRMLDVLPHRMQTAIIGMILKEKKK